MDYNIFFENVKKIELFQGLSEFFKVYLCLSEYLNVLPIVIGEYRNLIYGRRPEVSKASTHLSPPFLTCEKRKRMLCACL